MQLRDADGSETAAIAAAVSLNGKRVLDVGWYRPDHALRGDARGLGLRLRPERRILSASA
jgi:hypothetical protein